MKKIKYLILLTCTFSSFVLNAQEPLLYLKKTDKNKILEIYLNNELINTFSEQDKLIGDVKISPDNKFIATLLVTDNAKYYDSISNRLIIITPNGKVKHLLNENVRKYQWSNNSRYLAFITGQFYEGGTGYRFEKLSIYDLFTKKTQVVKGDFDKIGIYEFAWSPGDTSLLIKSIIDLNVFEYNLIHNSLKLTQLKDVNISPDGKYYYQKRNPLLKQEFAVYNTKTNVQVKLDTIISSRNNLNYNKYGRLIGWAPDEQHSLLFKEIDEDVEYEDIVVQKKTDEKPEIVIRDYKSRKIKGVQYKFYDVVSDKEIHEIKSTGVEHKLIYNPKHIIIQENGYSKLKEVKNK